MSHIKKEMISFFLTSRCNLDCVYCYTNKEEGKHKKQNLPFEFAKLGIDTFIEKYPYIRFFGAGEPTQAFELMKKIYNYSHSKVGDKLIAEIQTNGVFGKNVRNWLSKNINHIWVSFDGKPEIQNANRPIYKSGKPSSPIIEDNVKFLTANSKDMTGARVTITNTNVNQQIDMIDYFIDLGIKHIWTDPLFPEVGDVPVIEKKGKIESLIDIDLYIEKFLEAQEYAKSKDIFYGSFLSCNFDEESEYHCRANIPLPHFTTDGYISACDMALFGEDQKHMDVFIYGKWNKKKNTLEFNQEKIRILQSRKVSNMDSCKNCEAKLHCGGYCLGEVLNETGDLFKNKDYTCNAIKKLHKVSETNFGCYKYLHP